MAERTVTERAIEHVLSSDSASDSGLSEDGSDEDSDAYAAAGAAGTAMTMKNLGSLASVEVAQMSMRRKTLAAILKEAAVAQDMEGPKLGLFDLICIGIGGCVGSGVFVLSGEVLPVAGPAATLSWMISGLACLMSGLSYMEMSSRLPTAGSTYVYSYHSLGELAAVIGSVCLTLEYGVSGAGVARSWAKEVATLVDSTTFTKIFFTPYAALKGTNGPAHYGKEETSFDRPETVEDYLSSPHLSWLAGLMMFTCVLIVTSGGNCGKMVTNAFSVAKVTLIFFMVLMGLFHWNQDIFGSFEKFAPGGTSGIISGATLLFFGFIGFDEVCCLASRSKDPVKTMPRAIAGTLLGATIISGSAQLALACISPSSDKSTSFAIAFKDLGMPWAANIVTVGEAMLLPLVVFVSFLPQPELTAAMAEDGVLPSIFCKKNSAGHYVTGSLVSGGFMVVLAIGVPFAILWDVISLGVLVGFNFTNASLIQLRYHNGGRLRYQWVSLATWGALLSAGLGAYLTWKGYLAIEMDSASKESGNKVCLFIGLAFIVVEFCILGVIAFKGKHISEGMYPSEVFKVPLVPWIPGISFVANCFMMATISWSSHIFFLAMIIAFLALYVLKKLHRKFQQAKVSAKEDSEATIQYQADRIAQLEKEIAALQTRIAGMGPPAA